MGQQFSNYQNTIGLHPHATTTTSCITGGNHTITHFPSTAYGINDQMQYPQQHSVKGNNPYGSGNYPFSKNMTSCIGPNPNHASIWA